ncbi:Oxidoreductase-like protein [Sarocladium implicatum]|nr:Oxidoreductase-like protein [Sarocladium implicatum]
MSVSTRLAPRLRQICFSLPSTSRTFTTSTYRAQEEWPQRTPLGGYYESIIRQPPPYPFEEKPEQPPSSADPEVLPEEKKPETTAPRPTKKKPGRKPKSDTSAATTANSTPSQSPVEASPVPSPPPTSAQEKARIVFGTRLAGPTDRIERLNSMKSKSSYIAGVLVPPMPDEPDNCCMSGCVNCVWDLYREEMEDYTAKSKEAQARLEAASSVDEDGGGQHQGLGVNVGDTKIAKDLWEDDLFKNVPVGIREFMKQEKRLKEQHEREGSQGG